VGVGPPDEPIFKKAPYVLCGGKTTKGFVAILTKGDLANPRRILGQKDKVVNSVVTQGY
jgi:hypothetical protein